MHGRGYGAWGVRACGLAIAIALASACGGPPATGARDAPKTPIAHVRDDVIVELYDLFGKSAPGTTKAWGFSAIVRHRGRTILFDSGGDATILANNARALGVDLRDVDVAILSHDHGDHTSGLDAVLAVNPNVVVYAPAETNMGSPFAVPVKPPNAALPPLSADQQYLDGATTKIPIRYSGRYWKAHVEFVNATREIAPGVTLVATSSPYTGTFQAYPPRDPKSPDLAPLPELSLVLDTQQGDVLLVGCSHSGVENIVRAVREARKRPIDLLEGGFHLFPYDDDSIRTIAARLHDEHGVRRVAPAHCTGHAAFQIFSQVFGDRYVKAGLASEVPIAP